jgi:fructuronate reductase
MPDHTINKLCQRHWGMGHAQVHWPAYDRAKLAIGVAHIGPGAFFRAHLAAYIDDLLPLDPTWAISAIALKTSGFHDAIKDQDGLYVLAQLDREISYRVIGAICETLVAAEHPAEVLVRLSHPDLRLVSLTITEKGYCLDGEGRLNTDHPDIQHDLAYPDQPRSAIGWLVAGLRRRYELNLPAFSVLSCDNLSDNGGKLKRAMMEFATLSHGELADWIGAHVSVPRTMVDSITPATDDALRARIRLECGLCDAWPIQREAFRQLVIEGPLKASMPPFAQVGVEITDNVAGYEAAKLRLLNGAHSTLAYIGSLKGYETVADAMADPDLAAFVSAMMREDIAPFVPPVTGLDLNDYIDQILARFKNPAIRHLLSQIAWDGSAKLPFRLLATIADAIAAGHSLHRLALPIAAWIHFVIQKTARGEDLTDPKAAQLESQADLAQGNGPQAIAPFLELTDIFGPALAANTAFQAAVADAYDRLARNSL